MMIFQNVISPTVRLASMVATFVQHVHLAMSYTLTPMTTMLRSANVSFHAFIGNVSI